MLSVGVDIGSRTIEVVALEDGEIVESRQTDTGFDPLKEAKKVLKGFSYDRLMATGYGRSLMEASFQASTVSEIKAFGVGARALEPSTQIVLDIGGQDSKVISLDNRGKISKFDMNDRCAAGTGKFLEIMASSLGYSLEEFGREALKADKYPQINSMCAVFAESEITSLVAKGEKRLEIALGLHDSVARRAAGMLKKFPLGDVVFFAGGVAKNPCICQLLEDKLKLKIHVPKHPQKVGALGAALLAGS